MIRVFVRLFPASFPHRTRKQSISASASPSAGHWNRVPHIYVYITFGGSVTTISGQKTTDTLILTYFKQEKHGRKSLVWSPNWGVSNAAKIHHVAILGLFVRRGAASRITSFQGVGVSILRVLEDGSWLGEVETSLNFKGLANKNWNEAIKMRIPP